MRKGFTLIELVIVMAVLAILASVAMPLARVSVKRGKEIELRQNLRIMRQSVDKYKENYDKHLYKNEEEIDRSGYPKTLEELVEKKLLRRIPIDPFTGKADYITTSYTDDPESSFSDGKDVYDVRSASDRTALDGTKYSEW
ncbi:MAG: hypothetical protein A2W63_01695 [Deltaproteobacteria bacterium RIFCSPLOWO2_02_44_9]|nr:MAG: hypothetical protein A2W63_01695 [Deltaproteobacteria bacterium RIFCSPLOWO2_02_44_9]